MTHFGAFGIHEREGLRLPTFVFDVPDARAEERRLAPHFVSVLVVVDDEDRPFVHVAAPDVAFVLGLVGPFSTEERRALDAAQQAAAGAVVAVRDAGHAFELSRFTQGVVLDFAGEVGRAVRLARSGELDRAEQLLLRLRQRDLVPSGVCYELGRILAARGDFDGALELFDVEIEQHTDSRGRLAPFTTFPLHSKAVTFRRMGRFEDARHAFEHVLRMRPNYVEALLGYASLVAQHPHDDTGSIPWLVARAVRCQPQAPAVREAIAALAPVLGVSVRELGQRLERLGRRVDLEQPAIPG